LKGWQVNTIISLYGSQPWGPTDTGDDISLTNERVDRWNFSGDPSDFKSTSVPVPYFPGATNTACVSQATTPGLLSSLQQFGCYVKGKSAMTPPALGTFGDMRRNVFRDSGFRNVDLSVVKNWTFKERFSAQFRAEFFNVLNHPNFANPYGGNNGFGQNDPSSPGVFGCGCATPDVAATNPIVGSGGPRAMQLGLKLTY
jgi:hypothetical protein